MNTILGTVNTFGGAFLTYLGNRQQASTYRQAGNVSLATAKYNAALIEAESAKDLNALSRQVGSFISTQRTQIAKQGLGNSKSALALLNDSLVQMERRAIEIRNTSDQQQQATIYQGRVAQWQAEEQARQANSAAMSGLFSAIGSSLTRLF